MDREQRARCIDRATIELADAARMLLDESQRLREVADGVRQGEVHPDRLPLEGNTMSHALDSARNLLEDATRHLYIAT
ncbi:MAG: hypothetical protein WA991_04025 [Ornithinimicrobium sp.]